MKYCYILSALVASVSAHGLPVSVTGANGVVMPALNVIDGTPRDAASPASGAEADTTIIRTREMGTAKASALGRNKAGPIDAAKAIATFMGTGGASANTAANKKRQLAALLGGGKGKGSANAATGQKTAKGTVEGGVAKAAGTGAQSGMPTTSDDGTVTMSFHQVNQDGAGPLTASVDATSGGTDPAAFKDAKVLQDVPGIGIGGLSAAQTTDFDIKVQMPAGTQCTANVGGVQGVCVVRVQNAALAGPFGGSVAVVQSAGAKKRAVEYNLRKRHMARGILGKVDLE